MPFWSHCPLFIHNATHSVHPLYTKLCIACYYILNGYIFLHILQLLEALYQHCHIFSEYSLQMSFYSLVSPGGGGRLQHYQTTLLVGRVLAATSKNVPSPDPHWHSRMALFCRSRHCHCHTNAILLQALLVFCYLKVVKMVIVIAPMWNSFH